MSSRIVLIGVALAALCGPAWAFDDSGGSMQNAPAVSMGPTQAPSCRKAHPPLTAEQKAERRAIQAQRLAQLTPDQLAERRARRAEQRAEQAAHGKAHASRPPC